METTAIDLKNIVTLLSFDFRGTSINKELENFFLVEIIPALKTNLDTIKLTVKDFDYNVVLLYLLVKEIPMTPDLLIYLTGHFFHQIEYKNGVNSHVQKLMGSSITEDRFVSALLNQIQRLRGVLTEVEVEELLIKLFTTRGGNGWKWIAPIFLREKLISLETIISLTVDSRSYYCPTKVEYYPTGFHSMMLGVIFDYSEKINTNEILKNVLLDGYFNHKSLFADGRDWLEMTKILLKKLKLKKDQILRIKKYTVDHLSIRSIVTEEFCNLVFNYQSSISSLQVKKWLEDYRIEEKIKKEQEKNTSSSGGGYGIH